MCILSQNLITLSHVHVLNMLFAKKTKPLSCHSENFKAQNMEKQIILLTVLVCEGEITTVSYFVSCCMSR